MRSRSRSESIRGSQGCCYQLTMKYTLAKSLLDFWYLHATRDPNSIRWYRIHMTPHRGGGVGWLISQHRRFLHYLQLIVQNHETAVQKHDMIQLWDIFT